MRLSVLFAAMGAALALAGCAGAIRDRIYFPASLAETPVTFAGETPQDITARTGDGLDLAGYYWPAASGTDTLVVYFHGNGNNQLVGAARAEPLRKGGHGVLVASYRGYGGNPGSPSETGLFADGEAWMAKARELAPGAKIYLFGHSLGGAVALEMAARHEVAGVATLGAAGVEVAQSVLTETQTAILPLVPYLDTLRWVFIAVALGGIAVTIYARIDDWRRGRR